MTLIQTSIIAGMDKICVNKVRAHVVLHDKIAAKLILLSHELNKPMTHIVATALDSYSNQLEQKGGEYDKQRSLLI